MSNVLTDYRSELAALLRNELDDDIGVHDSIPDAIAPPAVYVTWSNPWLVSFTWCEFTSQISLIAVAQRIEPGGSYNILESLITQLTALLKQNQYAVRDVTSPFPLTMGSVDYLAASVNIIQEMDT